MCTIPFRKCIPSNIPTTPTVTIIFNLSIKPVAVSSAISALSTVTRTNTNATLAHAAWLIFNRTGAALFVNDHYAGPFSANLCAG